MFIVIKCHVSNLLTLNTCILFVLQENVPQTSTLLEKALLEVFRDILASYTNYKQEKVTEIVINHKNNK